MKGLFMRKRILASALVGLGLAGAAQAATITVSLKATPVAGTPGLFDVGVYCKSDAAESAAANDDGGVAGFQFDILSVGNTLSVPVQAGVTPALQGKVKNTYALSGYTMNSVPSTWGTQRVPDRLDASAANGYSGPPDVDTDLDALGGSFADTSLGYGYTKLGKNADSTGPSTANGGLGDLVSTEQWQLTSPSVADSLNVVITGPTYYDFNNAANNFISSFQTVVTAPTVLTTVPEPASMGLLAGLVGLAGLRRRKA